MFEDNVLKVQYLGQKGYTYTCLLAMDAILNSGIIPEEATIVSLAYGENQEEHLFLLWNCGHIPLIIVPSGFASGYPGEGPKGFSLAICMLREKNIPLKCNFVDESQFELLNTGKITNPAHSLLINIKAGSEKATFPWPSWVSNQDEELLKRGQLWRKMYWRQQKTDFITEAISDVDIYCPQAGERLRLALGKLEKDETAELQATGICIRDAWIEFVRQLCQEKNIDTTDLTPDDVTGRFVKLGLEDEIKKLAKSTFDLSLKNQHDRRIAKCVAKTCIMTAAFTMQTLLELELIRTVN